jgi:para-nitrobenzyl esterase
MDYVPPAYQIYRADQPDLNLPAGPRSAGAYHSGELAYVFNNVGKVGDFWNPSDTLMAERITDYWTQFARTGNPNTGGQPEWTPYSPETHNTLTLNVEGQQISGALRDKVDLLDLFMSMRNSENSQ